MNNQEDQDDDEDYNSNPVEIIFITPIRSVTWEKEILERNSRVIRNYGGL